MIRTTAASAAAFAIVLAASQPAFAAKSADKKLGKVHFETSCNAKAQRLFDKAMLYQHSFWYRASQRTFEETLKADPNCAIAYWGIALSLLNNPHNAPPPANLPLGAEAVEKARALAAKTQRERDYIEAIAEMYKDYQNVGRPARIENYLKAAERVAQAYPKDDEAQIAYAITLNVAASPNDKTYARQIKGAALLEPIFKRQPQHPGVAHYLIHLYDYPVIAEKGLGAARRYAKIAPAAPHAQHMPSHIFTRVGYWKDSIASNLESARAAKESKETTDQLHAMDYLVYAYLQLAQDKHAQAVIDEMRQIALDNLPVHAGPYAVFASQARYVIERQDWKGAAALEVKPTRFGHAEAMTHFARALGAARSGDPDAAAAEIARLTELRQKLTDGKDAYWAEIVDIQRQGAQAWALFASGKQDEGLAAMRAAADAEDRTEKSPVTPGPLAPARELYGAMLLDRGMAKEALAAYEAVLKKEPNRLATYVGATNAAAKAGDGAKAKEYAAKVMMLTKDADSQRPEVMELKSKRTAAAAAR